MRGILIAGFTLLLAGCTTLPSPSTLAPVPAIEPLPIRPVLAAGAPGAVMVDRAAAMLGQPYRRGGAAPGGFDCSGLVLYAAAQAGVALPRTAREQLRAGAPVSRSQLRAGDLVFMHLQTKELHVGIALDNERFIHAPSTGERVRINSLDAQPYARAFFAARRVVDPSRPPPLMAR